MSEQPCGDGRGDEVILVTSYKKISVVGRGTGMAKRFHHLKISVFAKADAGSVAAEMAARDALAPLDRLLPFPSRNFFEGQKIWIEKGQARYVLPKLHAHLTVQQAEGFESSIAVLTLFYGKDPQTNAIFDAILAALPVADWVLLRKEAPLHADTDGHFFLRLDKSALTEGEVRLTTGGDCFRLDFALAAYPKNATTIRACVERLLGERGKDRSGGDGG